MRFYLTFSFKSLLLFTLLPLLIGFFISPALAQDAEEDKEIQGVESELEKNIPSRANSEIPKSNSVITKKQDALKLDYDADSNLSSQVVIIQKNYMPKTGRFSISGGLTLFPSDVFFKTFGAQARFGYHLNETWGLELSGILLTSTKSTELKDLENKQGVTANNLATLGNYLGANIYFCNMYGKYALNDREIFPFEIYQTVGIGNVSTNKSTNPAVSLGFGQLLSLSRNDAVRFDLSLLFYQTETVTTEKQQSTSLLVTFAYGGLFPTVGKRW